VSSRPGRRQNSRKRRRIRKAIAVPIIGGICGLLTQAVQTLGQIDTARATHASQQASGSSFATVRPPNPSPPANSPAPPVSSHPSADPKQSSTTTVSATPKAPTVHHSAKASATGQSELSVQITIINPPCQINTIIQICTPLSLTLRPVVSENGGSVAGSCQVIWTIFKSSSVIFQQPSPCSGEYATGLVLQLGGPYEIIAEVTTGSGGQAESGLTFNVVQSFSGDFLNQVNTIQQQVNRLF
jgi:hypothetical protein